MNKRLSPRIIDDSLLISEFDNMYVLITIKHNLLHWFTGRGSRPSWTTQKKGISEATLYEEKKAALKDKQEIERKDSSYKVEIKTISEAIRIFYQEETHSRFLKWFDEAVFKVQDKVRELVQVEKLVSLTDQQVSKQVTHEIDCKINVKKLNYSEINDDLVLGKLGYIIAKLDTLNKRITLLSEKIDKIESVFLVKKR